MKPATLLFIVSNEHRRDANGCYGNTIIQTPNLDSLAVRGTRFTNAYTNSPICVPARASFASGHYVHQTGHWDNAFPSFGQPTGWAHELRNTGRRVDPIGKLHYRSADEDNRFCKEIDVIGYRVLTLRRIDEFYRLVGTAIRGRDDLDIILVQNVLQSFRLVEPGTQTTPIGLGAWQTVFGDQLNEFGRERAEDCPTHREMDI
jgi:arylsulfatase A-like enzyme